MSEQRWTGWQGPKPLDRKAVLAFMPDPKVETLLGKEPLARFTERTITDRVLLRAQLNIIRCRGYAIDDEEILPGIRCVGAPIIRADGLVTASISVAGPSYRLTSDRAEQLGPELIEATRRIGTQLGSVRRDIDQRDQNATVVAASDTHAFE